MKIFFRDTKGIRPRKRKNLSKYPCIVNSGKLSLHDNLFRLLNPRIQTRFRPDTISSANNTEKGHGTRVVGTFDSWISLLERSFNCRFRIQATSRASNSTESKFSCLAIPLEHHPRVFIPIRVDNDLMAFHERIIFDRFFLVIQIILQDNSK